MKLFPKVILSVFLGLWATVASAQDLVMAHALSSTSHYGLGVKAFADKLHALSGGKYNVEQAPAGQLGGERDLIEGAQIGSVDLAIVASAPLANFVPEISVFDLPFLFRGYDHARAVLDGEIGDELLQTVSQHNLRPLAWSENGFRNLTNSKHEVSKPADLVGLKIRTMENRLQMAAFKGMGASPTPMAFNELIPALQQGVVDGQENPLTVITSSRMWEVQKYYSATRHVYSPAIILASPAIYDGLSDEEKGWFKQAADVAVAATRAEVTRLESSGVEVLRQHGMKVTTDIDRAAFAKAAEAASYKLYTDSFGSDLIDKIRAVK
ncbi:TRAP transporter substrate-binding protein [Marinobacter sp. NFXS9]|uniref:TRAP transporter substrate-binding protein n=1 Tax=Marinobacter sp. NFXS9 TaxID=2818433 RepID=UPI0032DE46ED